MFHNSVHTRILRYACYIYIVQELCESRGGRPGLSVLTSLLVSVDVKIYWTVLRHWSQLVPNLLTDIRGHWASLHHACYRRFLTCMHLLLTVLYVSIEIWSSFWLVIWSGMKEFWKHNSCWADNVLLRNSSWDDQMLLCNSTWADPMLLPNSSWNDRMLLRNSSWVDPHAVAQFVLRWPYAVA